MRVLVVEDDGSLRNLVRKALVAYGYEVTTLALGVQGLDAAASGRYDLAVLDLTLPDIDGLEVARELRASGCAIPLLMLTSRDALADRLAGFAAGADDYLPKPFAIQELLARVEALGRRGAPVVRDALVVGGLVLDRRAREACYGGQPIPLAPKEYAVLELLMAHAGQALSRATIMERVWDYSFDGSANALETSIKRLRAALGGGSATPIQTVHGFGYKLVASTAPAAYPESV